MKSNCPKVCGKCCKVIILNNRDMFECLEDKWKKRKDKTAKWNLNNLTRISHLKAIKLNSYFKGHKDKVINYFICKNYDYENGKCKIYNKWRPYMCTDYPMYDKSVLDAKYFWNVPDCYFINQLMVKVN
jgi:Fe-S-cluster containining protein